MVHRLIFVVILVCCIGCAGTRSTLVMSMETGTDYIHPDTGLRHGNVARVEYRIDSPVTWR